MIYQPDPLLFLLVALLLEPPPPLNHAKPKKALLLYRFYIINAVALTEKQNAQRIEICV